MRNFCVVDSVIDIHNALDPNTNVYNFREHTYLRHNFTVGNHVYDAHYDAVKFVGHTEFSFFVRSLPEVGTWDARPMRPVVAVKKKSHPRKPKLSTRAEEKLATPTRRRRRRGEISSDEPVDDTSVQAAPAPAKVRLVRVVPQEPALAPVDVGAAPAGAFSGGGGVGRLHVVCAKCKRSVQLSRPHVGEWICALMDPPCRCFSSRIRDGRVDHSLPPPHL